MIYRIAMSSTATMSLNAFAPMVRREMRDAFDKLSKNPQAGEKLKLHLTAYHKYKVRHYRIIYEILYDDRILRIHAVGDRKVIYDEFNPEGN
ncbi:MAG: type II toxin-antitoxin system RelE/ParE family toxin [Candidatus Omnitrophica bacterium]|nr:type II toxin-antitoxin system RelE/ParE family toxin [Candidatus Omnitrophota bacterium]